MKKRNLFLGLLLASSVFSLAACDNNSSTSSTTSAVESSTETTPETTTTETTSTSEVSETTVTPEQKYTVSFVSNCDTAVESQSVTSKEYVTEPTVTKLDEENRKCKLVGWFTEATFENQFDFDNDKVTADTTLYAKWFGYEDVSCTFLPEKYSAGAIDITSGIFDISGEIRGRTKPWVNPEDPTDTKEWVTSLKNGTVQFTAPGDGTVTFYVQNGSSSAKTQFVNFQEDSNVTAIEFSGSQAVAPYDGGSPVVRITKEIKAGCKYYLYPKSGTIDFFQIDVEFTCLESDPNKFYVENVLDSDYLIGESFDLSTVELMLAYPTGKVESVAVDDPNVKVDMSGFDKTKSGTYKIKFKYGDFEEQEIEVNVWKVESLELGFNSDYLSADKTAAGNSQYINGKVKTIYALNDKLDTDYLSVTAVATLGTTSKEFLLNTREAAANISYSTFDSSVAGQKEVSVIYDDGTKLTTTYNVTVVDTAPVKVDDNYYRVTVDPAYTGIAGASDDTLGNQFATIGEALQYLELFTTAESKKSIYLEAGTYTEKLEITIPNLTIVGCSADTTIIEWDSLYGTRDEGGFLQVTDSTQTVAVRETATNCKFVDVTISNWWNSEARFNSKIDYLKENGLYTTKVNEHRALALLCQADKFEMINCKLLGYQDTVEFMKGRQYLYNTFISGTTDFIFGTNNTTLFESCEIRAIANAGYTTAFKGCSKGEEDSVLYGAIFYKCMFTADDAVTDKTTALGRTWGPYAAVAFIECSMDEHISTAASTGASSKERYVAMQNAKPTDSTVKFVEYGNTGDGAITATQAGVTYLTAETAANYSNLDVIFGTTNGNVSYDDTWTPSYKKTK